MPSSKLEIGTLTESARTEFGVWLDRLGDANGGWNWWFTGTFRDRTPDEIATGWTKISERYAFNALRRTVDRVSSDSGVRWVAALEYQKTRGGVPHIHSLIHTDKNARRSDAWAGWFKDYGYARIEPYHRGLGASFYLCKYMVKDIGDMKFSDNLVSAYC